MQKTMPMNWSFLERMVTKMKNKFKKSHGGRDEIVSVTYKKDLTNDCIIRSINLATAPETWKMMYWCCLGKGYEKVRDGLFEIAKELCRMPNDDVVVDAYLKDIGLIKQSPLTHSGNLKYKIGNFPLKGTYIIRCSGHWTCLKDGVVLDTWDCRDWKAQSFYKLEWGKK